MMKPLASKAAFGYLQSQSVEPNFWKMLFWLIKEVKGSNIKDETATVSKCQRAKQLLGEKTSLSQYYSRLTLTWWLRSNRINQSSDVGTLCSAASSLRPSSRPPFLCLSSISFQMSTSLIRLTWENCCLAAAPQLPDRSSTPSLLLLFCSPVTCDSNTLDLLPITTRPPRPSQTLLGSWGGFWHVIEVTWLTQSCSTKR